MCMSRSCFFFIPQLASKRKCFLTLAPTPNLLRQKDPLKTPSNPIHTIPA